jgi:hypothetical protein
VSGGRGSGRNMRINQCFSSRSFVLFAARAAIFAAFMGLVDTINPGDPEVRHIPLFKVENSHTASRPWREAG